MWKRNKNYITKFLLKHRNFLLFFKFFKLFLWNKLVFLFLKTQLKENDTGGFKPYLYFYLIVKKSPNKNLWADNKNIFLKRWNSQITKFV